jgi:hypothetical protein
MTETEWLACTDPMPLWEFLRDSGKFTERKRLFFAAACCRSIWHLLVDPRSRRAVEVAEQWADGQAGQEQLMAVWEPGWEAANEANDAAVAKEMAMVDATPACSKAADAAFEKGTNKNEKQRQASMLRDLFGWLPFRVAPIEPSWRTAVVMALAKGISAESRFQDLPVLADALEEAACTNPELLAHLRSPGPHVCGCFALDLILGKK